MSIFRKLMVGLLAVWIAIPVFSQISSLPVYEGDTISFILGDSSRRGTDRIKHLVRDRRAGACTSPGNVIA